MDIYSALHKVSKTVLTSTASTVEPQRYYSLSFFFIFFFLNTRNMNNIFFIMAIIGHGDRLEPQKFERKKELRITAHEKSEGFFFDTWQCRS